MLKKDILVYQVADMVTPFPQRSLLALCMQIIQTERHNCCLCLR